MVPNGIGPREIITKDKTLCKNYKSEGKQALSKIKNQRDKKSIIYLRLDNEFQKHYSFVNIFSLIHTNTRWWSQMAETVQIQGGKIYMVKSEVKS